MYSHFGVSQSLQHQNLKKSLFELRDNDCAGFVLPLDDMPAEITVDTNNFIVAMAARPLEERCANYTLHNCKTILDHRASTHKAPRLPKLQ
jgi:hypothetical protein